MTRTRPRWVSCGWVKWGRNVDGWVVCHAGGAAPGPPVLERSGAERRQAGRSPGTTTALLSLIACAGPTKTGAPGTCEWGGLG